MSNTCEGKRRRYMQVGLAIVCLVVLWVANVETDWVPRAAEGTLRRIVRTPKDYEVLNAQDENLADEPATPISKPEARMESSLLRPHNKVTAEQLLERDFQLEKESLQAEFQQQWDIANHSFGPTSSDTPAVRTARNGALSSLHAKYAVEANRLTLEYRRRMNKLADIDRLAKAGMLDADPNEAKMRLYLADDAEQEALLSKQKH